MNDKLTDLCGNWLLHNDIIFSNIAFVRMLRFLKPLGRVHFLFPSKVPPHRQLSAKRERLDRG